MKFSEDMLDATGARFEKSGVVLEKLAKAWDWFLSHPATAWCNEYTTAWSCCGKMVLKSSFNRPSEM